VTRRCMPHAGRREWLRSCDTYPQNRTSRTNTYRSRLGACQSVGTETESQMRALVGLRTQASAANSSDTRNLHEHEPTSEPVERTFSLYSCTTYFESEPRFWSVIWEWTLTPVLLPLSVPGQCQGQ
jgi:hypothetical protein